MLYVTSSFGSDIANSRAALSDNDRLLRRPLDVHGAVDIRDIGVLIVKLLRHDRRHIRYLLAGRRENFFSHHLSDDLTHGLVGKLILAEYRLALGQVLYDRAEKIVDRLALQSRYRDDLGKIVLLPVPVDQRQQLMLFFYLVDLVQYQNSRSPVFCLSPPVFFDKF